MAQAAENIAPRDVQLSSAKLRLMEFASNRFGALLEPHITYEDIMTPRFWSHCAKILNNGNIVEVRYENESHWGEFIVVEKTPLHVRLKKLRWVPLDDEDTPAETSADFEYKWNGPSDKHCVKMKVSGAIVAKQLPSKAAAMEWIASR